MTTNIKEVTALLILEYMMAKLMNALNEKERNYTK